MCPFKIPKFKLQIAKFPLKDKSVWKTFNINCIRKYEIFSSSNAGSPYRHERLDVPMATKREAVVWPGQFGFQNVSCIKCSNCSKTSLHYLLRGMTMVLPFLFCSHVLCTKPSKGDAEVLYPNPVKTVCPNASLRNWNTTLSERSVNMLRNLEKAQWLTSYQLHYTGTIWIYQYQKITVK